MYDKFLSYLADPVFAPIFVFFSFSITLCVVGIFKGEQPVPMTKAIALRLIYSCAAGFIVTSIVHLLIHFLLTRQIINVFVYMGILLACYVISYMKVFKLHLSLTKKSECQDNDEASQDNANTNS